MDLVESKPNFDSGNAEPPKCACLVAALGICQSIQNASTMPAAQPMISALRWNHRVYRPSPTDGSVCRMITPPMSCRSIENCGLTNTTNASAPSLTTSDASLDTPASCFGVASRLRYSL